MSTRPVTRIAIVGAGAIGGAVAARLVEAGIDVTVVARGAHADAIERNGLALAEPNRVITVPVPVVRTVDDLEIDASTMIALAVKSPDTAGVLDELVRVAPTDTRVACFQNGVANERAVAERFPKTYGVVVMMPAAHLEPGRVEAYASPIPGLFDIGLASGAVDDGARELASLLGRGGFDAQAVPNVMRWKYTKLLMNVGNAVEAMCGLDAAAIELVGRARTEAIECFRAARIDFASRRQERRRRGKLLQVGEIDGSGRGGGSSWQSLARGLGTIEADALNGEVVRIGAAAGVPTPVNELLVARANQAAADRVAPGSVDAGGLLSALG
ncbi:MAG: 2-dehydropantoate 2-reductase N-terminal domain-containing protein [Acidimicrobiia bacterium]